MISMHGWAKHLLWLSFFAFHFAFCNPAWSSEPTLARLSFWVPQEQMGAFESSYREQVVPMLKQRGLTASSQKVDRAAPGVFSRLFEFASPRDVLEKQAALQKDAQWNALLRTVGTSFGSTSSDGLIQNRFGVYAAPKSEGKRTLAEEPRGHWRNYDVSDGLPLSSVAGIVQDKDGYLWFGGLGGVARFDGINWQTYTTEDGLARNWVWPMVLDKAGNLWCGTGNLYSTGAGVSRYDGQKWKTFTTEDGLVDNRVISMLKDRGGNLWFGTYAGVSKYDGSNWQTFTTDDGLASNYVSAIFQDREGSMWFSTGTISGKGKGVSRYDPSQGQDAWTTLTKKDGLAINAVTTVFQDLEGDFWFGTADKGLSRYSPDSDTPWRTFTAEDGLAGGLPIGTIIQDSEGNIWVGSLSGVSRFDGTRWRLFTTRDGMAVNNSWTIFEDDEGHLWFGSAIAAVSKYSSAIENLIITSEGLSLHAASKVVGVDRDRDGILWIGTAEGGVHQYDGRMFTSFTTDDGLAQGRIRTMFKDREGVFWFGITGGGLSRYNPFAKGTGPDRAAWRTFTTEDGLASNNVESIFQDQEENLWFSSSVRLMGGKGVTKYDGQTFRVFTTQDGLPSNNVARVFQDREGSLFFNTDKGVSRCDPALLKLQTLPGKIWEDVNWGNDTVLAGVFSIIQDRDGSLWFGTWGGGVTRYDGAASTRFTVNDGLASNNAWRIIQDREGHKWFSTDRGVSRYDGQTFSSLTPDDGLAGNYATQIHEDTDGTLWIGTGEGITRFRRSKAWPPPVFIDAVIADRRYEGTADVKIPSTAGLMTFEFRAISYKTRPEAMVYRYRLRGYEEEWKTVRAREVTYEDLPTGNYTFEVIAVDRDLVYSERPATLALTVHLPYERIALICTLSIALVLIGWQTARVVRRDRRLREANTAMSSANKELFDVNRELGTAKEAAEKSQEAAEAANVAKSRFLANMSHEIRTPMNAILGYAQILERDTTLAPGHRDPIQTIHRSGDHLLKLINDVLDISKIEAGRLELQPSDFDLQSLLQNLSVMFQQRCQSKRLAWQIDAPEGDRIPVHSDEAKLSQVLINLLGNAVKFTQQGSVTLRARALPNNHYHFEITDTGPGITPEDQTSIFEAFTQSDAGHREGGTGLGLSISQRLLELMGGTLELESPNDVASVPPSLVGKPVLSEVEVEARGLGQGGGLGSTFSFTIILPPARAEVAASAKDQWSSVTHLAEGHTVTALVADDVLENRDVLTTLLTDIGVTVTLAENGKQALDQVVASPPDILFLDIRMPVMEGPEAAQRIWEEIGRDTTKIVAVSASTLDHERQKILELGFNGFLPKPFRTEQIYASLAEHLGVEFDYDEESADDGKPFDLEDIAIPEDLLKKLIQAAELSSVTELEQALDDVEELGPESANLATHLRNLSQDFKMEEILNMLKQIQS